MHPVMDDLETLEKTESMGFLKTQQIFNSFSFVCVFQNLEIL